VPAFTDFLSARIVSTRHQFDLKSREPVAAEIPQAQ
jgi:hypothetical protein